MHRAFPRASQLLRQFSTSAISRNLVGSRMSLPSTIKAIIVPKHGDFDVIELGELPFPKQEPNEILVKVNYAGVNFIDTYHRAGLYPAKSFPVRLGTESSGTIVRLPSDEGVLNDEQYKKRGFVAGGKVAVQYIGSMSEYISVPWKQVVPLPQSISLLTAAASLLQGLTALTFVTEAHNVQKGETVLIHTIAGGLGLIFAQLCKARGATVIGTTSTEEKAAIARQHGADHVIIYKKEDTVQRVLELTNGEGVHVIFDGVGKDTFESDFKMIRRKGSLVSVGNASGAVPPVSPLKLVEKNVKLSRPTLMNYIVTPEEMFSYTTELFELIQSGTVKINVHTVYPFTAEGVQQSQRDLTGGKTTGKLVIKVADE